MANFKKVITLLVAVCVVVCLGVLFAGCQNEQNPTTSTPQATEPQEAIYSITVKTAGGLTLSGVDYYVYDSLEKNKILTYGQLKNDGAITFTAPRSDKYVLELNNVPQGYDVKDHYILESTKLDLVLTASVIKEGEATDRVYKLGDVITDFTVIDTDGNSLTISEILKTKEAVVLNFWYTGCDPCKQEFPFLQMAYERYKDKLEVIAMDPYPEDTDEDVANFKEAQGLTFPMAKVDSAWSTAMQISAYPCTIIIDRYGVICMKETGKVTEEGLFEGAFNYYTSDNYVQKLVTEIEELDTLEYPTGHKRNPLQTSAGVENFQITVEGGKTFYAKIYRCDRITLRVQNPNISLVCDSTVYSPDENGVIEVLLRVEHVTSAVSLEFVNTTEETQNINVELLQPPGTVSTPIEMTYGELNVLLEKGYDQGMFYLFTADKTGYLVLTVTGVTSGSDYEIQIDNLTTMRSDLFSESCTEDADGNLTITIAVKEGEEIRFAFMRDADYTGTYPETTIQTLVSFSEDEGAGALEEITYSLTFKDVEGLPMAGITATFTVNGQAVVLISDEDGVITTVLPEGNYLIQVVYPDGFTADASQFLLTAEKPAKEVEVRLFQEKEITYTFYVKDHDGLPVVGAVITVGNSFVRTDANGKATFRLPVDNYVATIVAPEGYICKTDSISFGVRPEVNIVLENSQSESRIPYSVTVVDGKGKPFANAVVRFVAEDGTAVLAPVNDQGIANVILIRRNYTVELVFQQSGLRYEDAGLQLTGEVTSTTVVVAPGVSGKPLQISPTTSSSTYSAYYVQVGHTFVDVEPLSMNYFLFKPTQTGTYKIWVNKSGAEVENWQTTAQTTPNTSGVEDNILTLEVTALGKTYVVGLDTSYDITNVIMTVFRVPDCIVDPYPVTPNLPEEPYQAHYPSYAELKYVGIHQSVRMVRGDDGFYHLDSKYGPIIMLDLRTPCYGVSFELMLTIGEMAWYNYDEDGYPIYKKDYSECMRAYLAAMDQKSGLYPLTDDLFTMIRDYGSHAGWWDPESDNYLFESEEDLTDFKYAWMFAVCYIFIEQDECEHEFGQWEAVEGENAMIHRCPYCGKEEFHYNGVDCGLHTAGQWEKVEDQEILATNCTICGHELQHKITEDCSDETCEDWYLAEDELSYLRTCRICQITHLHIIGQTCQEEHFDEWTLTEDETAFVRHCGICGHEQKHTIGESCMENHFDAWTLTEDETAYIRHCGICGHEQKHTIDESCAEGDYTQWQQVEGENHFARECKVCGHQQTHTIGESCTEEHYTQWQQKENETDFVRQCVICGHEQVHTPGQTCAEEHFDAWKQTEDETGFIRHCGICGYEQKHITGESCAEEHYGQWQLPEGEQEYIRKCLICDHVVQKHTVAESCGDAHLGQWELAEGENAYVRKCVVCGHVMQKHAVGTECDETTCSAWGKNPEGTHYQRTCNVCQTVYRHEIGVDCQEYYTQWALPEGGEAYERRCEFCGEIQKHVIGVDCDETTLSSWEKEPESDCFTRTCALCNAVQRHEAGVDCEGHYGPWSDCDDGVNRQCVCQICGNTQIEPIPVIPPEEPEDEPKDEPEDEPKDEPEEPTEEPEEPAPGDEEQQEPEEDESEKNQAETL